MTLTEKEVNILCSRAARCCRGALRRRGMELDDGFQIAWIILKEFLWPRYDPARGYRKFFNYAYRFLPSLLYDRCGARRAHPVLTRQTIKYDVYATHDKGGEHALEEVDARLDAETLLSRAWHPELVMEMLDAAPRRKRHISRRLGCTTWNLSLKVRRDLERMRRAS